MEPLVVLIVWGIRAEGTARAEHRAVGNLRPELVHRGLAGGEDGQALLHEAARARLQDERLEVAVPEARVDDIGLPGKQRGDLGVVLAREELRHLRGLHLQVRHEHFHRQLEIAPGILAPGVVLV